jgi:outer membrane biosynthesis protein TonB
MRIAAQILSISLLVGVGVTQSTPASKAPQASSQPSKAQNGKAAAKNPFTPKTAAKPQTAAAPAKPSAPAQAKAKPSKKAAPVAKATPKPKQSAPAKPEPAPAAVAQNSAPKLPSPGRRDPFLSPIAAAAARGPAANCSTGKHCLAVGQIALKGIVQTKSGNIAMVENASRRSYYLRENDALFDGAVVKITGDSVTFRQEGSDVLGRPVSKEVVKKVSAPAV